MNDNDATVFIVDDDAGVRQSLARLVRSAGWGAAAFPSAGDFLASEHASSTGCMILDVRMPDMSGPELYDHMIERGVSLPVIFLTGNGDVPTGVRAMKRGAMDFLVKPVDDETLLQAIRGAVERHIADQRREKALGNVRARLLRLSSREREVMAYVIGGCLNKQIAAELDIAEKTVKVHRSRVMEKLDVRSISELVRLCDAAGIEPRHVSSRRPAEDDR